MFRTPQGAYGPHIWQTPSKIIFPIRFEQTIASFWAKWLQRNYYSRENQDIWPFLSFVSKNMSCVLWCRRWYAAPLCSDSASGLLRLEELVRRFLISRETLSVRMLDDNLDPTPLLKEIRDDKVATIIIDANASVSYLILKKVSSQTSMHTLVSPTLTHTHTHSGFCTADAETLWDLHFSLSCPRLGNGDCSHEGRREPNICKIIKQLPQSPRGRAFVVVTQLCFFNLLCPWEVAEKGIFHHCQ